MIIKHGSSGIRLQLLVSGSIVAGMLLLAAAIIFHSYNSNRDILIDLAQENAQHIAVKIESQIESHTQPIISAIKLLAQDTLVVEHSLNGRLAKLDLLKMILDDSVILSSVYLGYGNGDFFLLRKLKNQMIRNKVSAPQAARYMVQSVERSDSGNIQRAVWFFYDNNFSLIQQREVPQYQFDPRTRRWFTSSVLAGKLYIDEPYTFYTTQEVGVTLSIKSSLSETVIGMDASFADLSAAEKRRMCSSFDLFLIPVNQHVLNAIDC